jgi:hypothetical protein
VVDVNLFHQHQTMSAMKITTILLAALFTLQVSFLMAGNESTLNMPSTEISAVAFSALSPVAPMEATFDEVVVPTVDVIALAPVTPGEVTFEEFFVPVVDFTTLAPVAPAEATFEITDTMLDFSTLSPTTPAEADFE